MAKEVKFTGVFPILVTPFDAAASDQLRSILDAVLPATDLTQPLSL